MQINNSTPTFTGIKYGYKKVDNYLYKGSAPTISQLLELHEQGVNQIFDFRHDDKKGLKFIEIAMCKLLGIKYHRMKFNFFNESENPTLKDFEKVAAAIKKNGEEGGKTLLHCNSGHHRTGQMVEFYNLTRGLSLDECKKTYPKTYKKRVEIVIRDLVEKDDYFDRKYSSSLPLNPIKRSITNYNNRVCLATRKAFVRFRNLLLS